MKITKVQYGKTYSLGNYCSERIDLEASVDEEEETVTGVIADLKKMCDAEHKANNPHLYQEEPIVKTTQQRELIVPLPQQYDTKYLRIMGCKTIEELEAIEDITDDLKLVYDSKKKKLQAK